MERKFFIISLLIFLLSACGDGVPKIENPHKVVVDGKNMTQANFLQTYCIGKVGNETCDKVKNAMSKDATKSALPKGW